jgi:hypothetical protein
VSPLMEEVSSSRFSTVRGMGGSFQRGMTRFKILSAR